MSSISTSKRSGTEVKMSLRWLYDLWSIKDTSKMKKCILDWNQGLPKRAPYSELLKGLSLSKAAKEVTSVPLFCEEADLLKPRVSFDYDRVISCASIFTKTLPETNTPESAIRLLMLAAKKSQSPEENLTFLCSLLQQTHFRAELSPELRFLDFVLRSPRPSFNLDLNLETAGYFDLDLGVEISESVPRRYKSTLFRVASNSTFLIGNFFRLQTPILWQDEEKLLHLLETTRNAKMANLDTLACATTKTVESKKYVNPELRICSNDKELFDFVSKIASRFRNIPSPKAPLDSKANTVTPKSAPRKAIPKRVRDRLWRETFSALDGECYCCSTKITFESWEAGHIVAAAKGGSDEITNLRPVCGPCNKSMGTMNMEEFKSMYGF